MAIINTVLNFPGNAEMSISRNKSFCERAMLYAVGYANTDFNVVKTWTEYLNRLTGMTIGFLIFLTLWFSRAYLKTDKAVFYLSLAVFLLVGFQGWHRFSNLGTHAYLYQGKAHGNN
jgi:cytochrome c oxidase assembly protein subunit 15